MKRFDVCLVDLSPTLGSEINKTRPCIIVSPDTLNRSNMVIAIPMTSSQRQNLWRIPIVFNGVHGDAVLDQIRSVDISRLVKHWGNLEHTVGITILQSLRRMFAE